MAATILQRIVETKRAELAAAMAHQPIAALRARVELTPLPRDFYAAVTARSKTIHLIAEIKKASPSTGLIRTDFDPVVIAKTYASCAASALSVLTDRTYFQGDPSFIPAIKGHVDLPVLRKDFIIDEYQVYESRAMHADAVLLIAAILTSAQIASFTALAAQLGLTTLLEVHDENELQAALTLLGPQRRALLGINNRDLASQKIELATTARLAAMLPPGTPFIAESGLKTAADVQAMRCAGASAVLIGETLMRSPDIAAAVRALLAST